MFGKTGISVFYKILFPGKGELFFIKISKLEIEKEITYRKYIIIGTSYIGKSLH